MEIGDLRHRVTFQKLITEVNENGFEIQTWKNYKTVWSAVSNLSGREYYKAAAIKGEKTVKFLIRYVEGIDESMVIIFRNKQYNITFVDNIKYINKYIEIKAVEVEEDG